MLISKPLALANEIANVMIFKKKNRFLFKHIIVFVQIIIHTQRELGRSLTNCNQLQIPNYMTKLFI